MYQTFDFRDQQRLDELAEGKALSVTNRDEGLVHISVKLPSYINALEAHRSGRHFRLLNATLCMVVEGPIDGELSLRDVLETISTGLGNEVRPCIHRGPGDLKRTCNRRLIAVVIGENVLFEHRLSVCHD